MTVQESGAETRGALATKKVSPGASRSLEIFRTSRGLAENDDRQTPDTEEK